MAQFIRQMTVGEFETLSSDDNACEAYLRDRRWPDNVCCPRCGSHRVYELAMMMTAKKGVAALEVQRAIRFGSYRAAHYMCHRIRTGLVDPEFRKFKGFVEVDETYVVGRA